MKKWNKRLCNKYFAIYDVIVKVGEDYIVEPATSIAEALKMCENAKNYEEVMIDGCRIDGENICVWFNGEFEPFIKEDLEMEDK